ncbi:MAG: TolC family protein [Calditrichaeota bacterium]|nr:MAG: TolC family protein [Calditrichota bacterium]
MKMNILKVKSCVQFLAIVLLFGGLENFAQGQQLDSLSLEICHTLAIDNSTISRQRTLHQQVAKASIYSVNTGYFPQLELNGQVNYQSDVTQLDITMPGFTIETPSKDQYRAAIDLNQLIYDGGYISRRKQLYSTSLQVEKSKLEVEEHQIKERINGLYLSVLLFNENIRLVELLKNDISTNITNLSAMLQNGIALKSNVDILQAERMKADQKLIELNSNKKSAINMLSILLGKELSEKIYFAPPAIEANLQDNTSNRSEFKLFDMQKVKLQRRSALINTRNMPKIYLFANGGYGRPGLNMLSNDFKWYGIAGVKLSIPLTNWLSTQYEKKVVANQQSLIDAKRADFARNNKMQLIQQAIEIDKYQQLIEKDKSIIAKRTGIKETESVKLANGVSTSNDYIAELNAENQAKLKLKLHEIQLMQSIINYNSLKGKI